MADAPNEPGQGVALSRPLMAPGSVGFAEQGFTPFTEGRYSTHILMIDFGPDLGVKKSVAKLTPNYEGPELVGRQVLCVVNFPPRQIGKHLSEVLTLGLPDDAGNVVLIGPD